MATLRMFEQIKTEPLQFYPQNFANTQPSGSVLQTTNIATVIGSKSNLSSDVRFTALTKIIYANFHFFRRLKIFFWITLSRK